MSVGTFETYLQARGKSDSTIQRYLYVVRDFTAFTGKKEGFTKQDILRYLAAKGRGTYKRFLYYSLSSLFKALELEWPLTKSDVPSTNDSETPYYNIEETTKILACVDRHGPLRDRALLHVAAIVGARREEYQKLNREDYKDGRVYIQTKKHGLPRWRALDPVTIKILEKYLKKRTDEDEAMFRSRKGGQMSFMQLNRTLKKYLKKAGVDKPRAGYHAFRRGLVTILKRRGLTTKEIKDYGGWKTEAMVIRYEQLEPGQSEERVKATHPFFTGDKGK